MYIIRSMDTVISVRVNKGVKEYAKEVATSCGLTLSAVINSYLIQIATTRRIEIYSPEPMSTKLPKLIGEVEKELKENKVSKKFDNVDDFIDDLKK